VKLEEEAETKKVAAIETMSEKDEERSEAGAITRENSARIGKMDQNAIEIRIAKEKVERIEKTGEEETEKVAAKGETIDSEENQKSLVKKSLKLKNRFFSTRKKQWL